MKSTGIVRKVDQLGRVVIPKELRLTLGIDIKDSLEIYVNGEEIIFKKYQPGCVFCDNISDVIVYKGRKVCTQCIKELSE